ncbi:MAG: DUF2586 family protein [Prevotella sp.]|nr:DUF2586 family protein [Prevotella sp.]
MNKLTITRENGNIGRTAPGEDHVSGLLFILPSADTQFIKKAADRNATFAIGPDTLKDEERFENDAAPFYEIVNYHVDEAFRANPAISLYLRMVLLTTTDTSTVGTQIQTMQRDCGGRLRQIAVIDCLNNVETSVNPLIMSQMQRAIEACDTELNAPLSVLYSPIKGATSSDGQSVSQFPPNSTSDAVIACEGVSVLIGADLGDERSRAIFGTFGSYPGIGGLALGLLSAAGVHESIGWVKKFPTGITTPGFVTGEAYTALNNALIEELDAAGYIFPVTYPGVAGVYLNDSHVMTAPTDDYAHIENVRTMDKAVRGIRAALTPELGGNIYIDASTGKMQPYTVEHLKTVAGRTLENMEKAGELSGYAVEIDPEQNVLATSTVDIKIKKVDVGVMRNIRLSIGNVTAL